MPQMRFARRRDRAGERRVGVLQQREHLEDQQIVRSPKFGQRGLEPPLVVRPELVQQIVDLILERELGEHADRLRFLEPGLERLEIQRRRRFRLREGRRGRLLSRGLRAGRSRRGDLCRRLRRRRVGFGRALRRGAGTDRRVGRDDGLGRDGIAHHLRRLRRLGRGRGSSDRRFDRNGRASRCGDRSRLVVRRALDPGASRHQQCAKDADDSRCGCRRSIDTKSGGSLDHIVQFATRAHPDPCGRRHGCGLQWPPIRRTHAPSPDSG